MKLTSVLFIFISLLQAQSLNLPPRSIFAPGGSELSVSLIPLSRADREEVIYQQIMNGNIPRFLRTFVPIIVKKEIEGIPRTLEFYTAPEYLAVGNDSDYFLCPMTPLLAQRIANTLHCTLPTKEMVDLIYFAAPVKLPPQPIPPDTNMTKVPRFIQHNDSVRILRQMLTGQYTPRGLIAGHKKDIIIHQKIYSELKKNRPAPVVIYGWHQLNGVPIQPPNNWHQNTYADYSHGVRLVLNSAMMDGIEVTLTDFMRDSVFHVFISDTVLTKPYYEITGE